jgi:LmbE family N-acetylglucosaminyl deacetylase
VTGTGTGTGTGITPPTAWADAIDEHAPPPMGIPSGRVLVVAAHPDDETLGAGGFLHAASAAGAQIELVVATDGEAAFGAPDPELGRARNAELRAALDEIGLGDVVVHRLGLPDSGLADRGDDLMAALAPLLAEADLCLVPWTGDPHPDHAAVAHAALAVAPARAHRWTYPIWTLPWCRPDDAGVPWPHAAVFAIDPETLAAKRRAIARFTSQVAPTPAGDAPILPADVLAHFDVDRELFFRAPRTASAPVSRFADLYAADADPWQTRTDWYERRKRDVVLACLPRERYAHAAEPGCGLGLLTAALTARCLRVTASDPVPAAADAARQASGPDAEVLAAPVSDPATLPADADLVVLSEVLYYLTPDDVAQVAERIPDGADVVLVHWRGWPAEAPRDAAATHRQLTADPRFTTLVEHVDEQFLLHVLRRR